MMKDTDKIYSVLDIGSNSVRALCYRRGKVLYSGLITTRLGEGTAKQGKLSEEAIVRTVEGMKTLREKLSVFCSDDLFCFATEAVRSAENGEVFLNYAKNEGFSVEVLDGDEEGELGLLGALGGKDGGIIDIGGASTEITVGRNGKIVYSHSLPLGAVRLYDLCGEDEKALSDKISQRIGEYGEIPKEVDYCFIGGTASAVCIVARGLKGFDGDRINDAALTKEDIDAAYEKIKNCSVEERVSKLRLSAKRAEIIVGGALMIKTLCEKFGLKSVTVKVNDNMVGYLRKKIYGEGYEKG
ncbi:MAG: hypothetical protein IJ800_00735 [Clostridia bacterium]|nr:hypothetical protein [Clostridia bacterium]